VHTIIVIDTMPATVGSKQPRPTPADLRAATGRTIRDIVAPGLDVLFCGINPGLYSAATGFHFARPGNRFWPALVASGFTPRRFDPSEGRALLSLGCGITNLVARTTATAAELSIDELRQGRTRLERVVRRYRPRVTAVVGITAYRAAFDRPEAALGRQPQQLVDSILWVLPNTSGLNAHHQAPDFARAFSELRTAVLAIERR
jgi:TDG/mug DNA glycosylase family protein